MGILRLIFFNNRCALCRVRLKLQSDKLCQSCFENLRLTSSLKVNKGTLYLWRKNRYNFVAARLYNLGRGSVYRILSVIVKERADLASLDASQIKPFYSHKEEK